MIVTPTRQKRSLKFSFNFLPFFLFLSTSFCPLFFTFSFFFFVPVFSFFNSFFLSYDLNIFFPTFYFFYLTFLVSYLMSLSCFLSLSIFFLASFFLFFSSHRLCVHIKDVLHRRACASMYSVPLSFHIIFMSFSLSRQVSRFQVFSPSLSTDAIRQTDKHYRLSG